MTWLDAEWTARIAGLLGARSASFQRVEGGGYTPAARLLCQTETARFFVKIGATPLTSAWLRREIHVYNTVCGPFLPRLVAWEDTEIEPILVLEDLSMCHWPPPWDQRRVDDVLAQIDAMHATKAALESFAQVHAAYHSGWQTVASDPQAFLSLGLADETWLAASLPLLTKAEARCRVEGDSLTHWDLRRDNMCLDESRVVFVDWNLACLSNPALDLGFWLPSLASEGGPLPDTILPDAPEIAAWVSGFFAARAGLPSIPDAPCVRMVQRQQLTTALPWVARALDLPPPAVL